MSKADRGSGSLGVMGIVALAFLLLGWVLADGQARSNEIIAAKASDLGALAAADSARGLNELEPCQNARRIVEANQASLVSCDIRGEKANITARVQGPGIGGFSPVSAERTSTAGPPVPRGWTRDVPEEVRR